MAMGMSEQASCSRCTFQLQNCLSVLFIYLWWRLPSVAAPARQVPKISMVSGSAAVSLPVLVVEKSDDCVVLSDKADI